MGTFRDEGSWGQTPGNELPPCPIRRAPASSARHRRAMTLLEVMVTVSIISLVSSGTALYAIHHYKTAQKQTAVAGARTVRAATQHYLLAHHACPSVEELISARMIDRGSETRDPWKGRYFVTCPDGDVMVASRGPDKLEWTADDILIPDLSHLADPFDESAPFIESPDMTKGLSVEEWLGGAMPPAEEIDEITLAPEIAGALPESGTRD